MTKTSIEINNNAEVALIAKDLVDSSNSNKNNTIKAQSILVKKIFDVTKGNLSSISVHDFLLQTIVKSLNINDIPTEYRAVLSLEIPIVLKSAKSISLKQSFSSEEADKSIINRNSVKNLFTNLKKEKEFKQKEFPNNKEELMVIEYAMMYTRLFKEYAERVKVAANEK